MATMVIAFATATPKRWGNIARLQMERRSTQIIMDARKKEIRPKQEDVTSVS